MIMRSATADAMMDAMNSALNAALGAAPTIECWDGTPPAAVGDADAGTRIASVACSNPAFGAVVAGVATLDSTTDDTSTVAGTVQYWRMKKGGTQTILQWTEGVDFITDDPAFDNGDTCHISLLEITYTVTPPDS